MGVSLVYKMMAKEEQLESSLTVISLLRCKYISE